MLLINFLFNFKKIDTTKRHSEWKRDYYLYHFGVDIDGYDGFDFLIDLVKDYLTSLMFNAYYTTFGCPSWVFHSKYDVAPLPSDVYDLIKTNKIQFDIGNPATPIEHACVLLPRKVYEFLPKKYETLIEEFPEYFPEKFKINVLDASKYRYSDPMIKKIDYDQFFARVREIEAE